LSSSRLTDIFEELTMDSHRTHRNCTDGWTANEAATTTLHWQRSSRSAWWRWQRTALRYAGRATLWLVIVLATLTLLLASMLAVQSDPAIIEVPAPDSGAAGAPTLMAQAKLDPKQSRDRRLPCFYDALVNLGGTVHGSGYQRTDPACQRW
jgi:hypothetical protein